MNRVLVIFVVISSVINLVIHGVLFTKMMRPLETFKEYVEQIPVETRFQIEESSRIDGLFDMMMELHEIPSQVLSVFQATAVLTILSAILTGVAFVQLLKGRKWAYNYVWSVVVFTGFLGLIMLDFPAVLYTVFASYVLIKNRSHFVGEIVEKPQ